MRELSIVELDLIVGGYDSGSSGSYDYGSSSVSYDADGNFSGEIQSADVDGMYATAQGWEFGIEIIVPVGPNGGRITGKASKKS